MWNAGLDEAQAGVKISRRNTNNLRYADYTTIMAESEEELKSLFLIFSLIFYWRIIALQNFFFLSNLNMNQP